MMRKSAQRSRLLLWSVLVAALLGAGCQQQSGPPLTEAPPTTRPPASSTTPSPTPAFDPSLLACEVGRIMSDATAAAARNTTDAPALARIYRDAARKIRAVAARAAGTPIGRAISNAAAAVDGLARQFATGSVQPPDAGDLTRAFEALPVCESG